MPPAAITVESLGKAYRIGLKDEVPDTLVGAATSWAKAPLRNFHNLRRLNTFSAKSDDQPDLIWALKDVSFEVPEGEVLGVIGRNGAGKSTLLKILSRITQPTAGRAVIHGRVSSLLEVGTGFHPELSGRENIYMNGTILGMRKREIDRKLDQIIDFSGIEKFLDTPIKRYSSGMKVRLAFAVAAHLEPEILIIDEVLAVGDAEFQKKCLGKMHDVARGGRTVLFVSHNMSAVQAICTQAILLKGGTITASGSVDEVIQDYLSAQPSNGPFHDLTLHEGRPAQFEPQLRSVHLTVNGEPCEFVPMLGAMRIDVSFESDSPINGPVLGLIVRDQIGTALFGTNSRMLPPQVTPAPSKSGRICCTIPTIRLMPGVYTIDLYFGNERHDTDIIVSAATFEVVASNVFTNGKLPSKSCGPFLIDAEFEVSPSP